VDGGGLDRLELLRYFRPLMTVRLDAVTAQQEANNQRQCFQRLIVELFPLDRVEAFIAAHLEAGMYPTVRTFDLKAGLMRPLENALARDVEPVQEPFDLEAERSGRYGKPGFDVSEYRYAVQLLQLRPGLALATLFLRGFLVNWASALGEASRNSLNTEQAPRLSFFLNNWNQASLVTVLYPAIAVHLRPRIEVGGKRIAEPAFTRSLMSDVMSWLTAKGYFARQVTVELCGYEARLSCAAAGILNQVLGKRGWLNTIFDKMVDDQHIPSISRSLERVVERGNLLADFASGTRASGSTEWFYSSS
jgi:hypothetical protein